MVGGIHLRVVELVEELFIVCILHTLFPLVQGLLVLVDLQDGIQKIKRDLRFIVSRKAVSQQFALDLLWSKFLILLLVFLDGDHRRRIKTDLIGRVLAQQDLLFEQQRLSFVALHEEECQVIVFFGLREAKV